MSRVLSVNLSGARPLDLGDRTVSTGIFKSPARGAVAVTAAGLDGDVQADRSVHGGKWKAVYLYPSEHYAFWSTELDRPLDWGAFGENLTTRGVDESISIGDRLSVGSAVLQVTEPRLPCAKLAARFGLADLPKRFLASGRTGFYLSVVEPGTVATGDRVRVVPRGRDDLSVAELVHLQCGVPVEGELLARAAAATGLRPELQERFQHRLAESGRRESVTG